MRLEIDKVRVWSSPKTFRPVCGLKSFVWTHFDSTAEDGQACQMEVPVGHLRNLLQSRYAIRCLGFTCIASFAERLIAAK